MLFTLPFMKGMAQDVSYNDTDFHLMFNSIDEMVGKNVRFGKVNYKEQNSYVYVKRGKRLVNSKEVFLPYQKYKTYHVEDIITDKDGNKYAQLVDEEKSNTFYILSPYASYLCSLVYDADECDRMRNYCKQHFVYRQVEIGENPISKPYDYLPYVEVGISGVDIFTRRNSDRFTIAFYYFTDNGDRFIEYDMIGLSSYKFLTKEELLNKEKEYQEEHKIKLDELAENSQKYGIKIATAIYKGGFWTEERVDELIGLVGKEEAEFVVSGEVHVGMKKSLCELSWGEPDKINKTTYAFGTREQWVYRKKNSYLYFEDDVLTAITEN